MQIKKKHSAISLHPNIGKVYKSLIRCTQGCGKTELSHMLLTHSWFSKIFTELLPIPGIILVKTQSLF